MAALPKQDRKVDGYVIVDVERRHRCYGTGEVFAAIRVSMMDL
jgi:hypothetical protein